ncbi:hypothetical protein DPEC_G00115060 [Dallia pectoralis]|uniref:Uncharacterized protein n=1 Tax=Dallia pectoralis TaxID=75939 RepID=A0ACC2GUI9_DALPE|nr:hypothetical protein DPEC_G00115060 [Dallia pectoralis]
MRLAQSHGLDGQKAWALSQPGCLLAVPLLPCSGSSCPLPSTGTPSPDRKVISSYQSLQSPAVVNGERRDPNHRSVGRTKAHVTAFHILQWKRFTVGPL